MRTPLEQSVLSHIRQRRMIVPGDATVVAVSGGADSVALLRILEKIRGELGITLAVAHFDHQLRGAESDQDAEFAAELARSSGLEFFLHREDVAQAAKRNRWNLEDAARRLRYGFFQRLVENGNATRVAIAHTADDQAETVLAHLIRGTGPTGLAGIYPVAGPIVRPLLEIRRPELREYLRAMKQAWREDATNNDRTRLRSRIRGELVPAIERDFSPRIVQHLCALAGLAREERVFWDALTEERFEVLVSKRKARGKGKALVVSVRALLNPFGETAGAAPTAPARSASPAPWQSLTQRLIRRIYREVRGDQRELTSSHVQQVIHLAGSARGKRVALPGCVRVERTLGDLVFGGLQGAEKAAETNPTSTAYQYGVRFGEAELSAVSVPEIGIRFRLKKIDCARTRSETKPDSPILDANSLSAPLILRNWRPGDAYTPHGRRRPRKLKQMFLAARISSEARRGWPVLESAGRVVWARGMPVAEGFCANEGTRTGVLIEEEGI
jgi:tRNA(Ile)-lysidine synthase